MTQVSPIRHKEKNSSQSQGKTFTFFPTRKRSALIVTGNLLMRSPPTGQKVGKNMAH